MVRPAPAVLAFVLRRLGFAGITLPQGVYLLPERMDDHALIAHELIHVAQIQRMGVARFYLTYLWQWARYGYHAMPLEREARGEC